MDFNKDFIISVIRQHRDDEEYYTTVLNTVSIPHDFFYHHINIFNTYLLSKHCILEDETIQYFLDEEIVEHTHILKYQILSSSMLKKYIQNINPLWDIITEYQDISCNILQIYADKLNWLLVSENQFMDLQFLIQNINHIHWDQLPFNTRMKKFINEGMITLFQQTNIWDNIGYCDNIDLETILVYQNKFTILSWNSILEHRDLTDIQIEEFTNKRNIFTKE